MFGILGSEVQVEVGVEMFIFKNESRTAQVPAYLLDDKYMKSAANVRPELMGGLGKVKLFGEKSLPPELCPGALASVLSIGMHQVLKKRNFIRPVVAFRNTETLSGFLHGYEAFILASAAYIAGVRGASVHTHSGVYDYSLDTNGIMISKLRK
jgi:hypothetical protein